MNLLKKAKNLLGAVAPTLGVALGGPMGGVAAKALTNALGLTDKATEEEVSNALLSADPAKLAEIRKIDNDFKVEMKRLEIDIHRIDMEDRDSARDRQARTGDYIPSVLAILTLLSFFGYIGLVTFYPDAVKADIGFINIAVGWLGGTSSTVVAYYFGSSSGSDKKDDMMRKG